MLAAATTISGDSTFFGDPSSSIYNAEDKPPNTLDCQYFVMLDGTTGRRVVLAFGYGVTDEFRYVGTREILNGEWLNDWIALATATPPQEYNLPLAGGVSGTLKYSKDQMGVVRLLGQVELASNQSGIINIGTMPEGYYLGYAVASVCCGWPDGGATIAPCTVVVNADGAVAINVFDASLKVFAVNVSFGS